MGQLKILKASAGSGKTFMLAYEYVKNVVHTPLSYLNILAVTFTNKATGEMKSRILKELHTLTLSDGKRDFLDKLINEEGLEEHVIRVNASKALTYILHDYSNFSVMTIDGFFQKIVRSFVKELHLECDYTIDFNINYLLKLAIDLLIHKADGDPQLKAWIDGYLEDNISASKGLNLQDDMLSLSKMILNEEFDKAYFENNRELLIAFFTQLSGIEKNIKQEITGKAKKFIDICNSLILSAPDFPGKTRGIYPYIQKISNEEIPKCSETIKKTLYGNTNWIAKGSKLTTNDAEVLKDIAVNLQEHIDHTSQLLNSIKAVIASHRTFVLLADISHELYEVCSSSNKMLLSNTNYLINKLIKGNDAPYIYEKIGNRFEIMMIDEFQDTSEGQWENFVPLLDNALSQAPEGKNVVTLVGDIKQSIYRWRGGDWRILSKGIEQDLGNHEIVKEGLKNNYRSKREIVDFNNNIIEKCANSINLDLNLLLETQRDAGNISLDFVNSHKNLIESAYDGMTQESPKSEGEGGYIEILEYGKTEDDDNSAAINLQSTINIIIELQDRGYNANDIAILVKSKKQAREIVAHIINYKKDNSELSKKYCLDIISAEGLSLGNSTVIKFIMSVYSLAIESSMTSRALYNRYLDRALKSEIDGADVEFIQSILSIPVIESFEKIVAYYNLGEKSNNMAYLQAMHSAVIRFSQKETGGVAELTNWWRSESENIFVSLPEGQNAIKIDTIHKSKGLQYKVVIIPYCQWGLEPLRDRYFWANSQSADFHLPSSKEQKLIIPYLSVLENSFFSEAYFREYILTVIESFNTFYVAVTRAEQELYIITPKITKKGKKISNYINEVIPSLGMKTEQENDLLSKYSYGAKKELIKEDLDGGDNDMFINNFKYSNYHDRIKLHLESDKYFADPNDEQNGETSNINARGKGILLHKLFEDIELLEDLDERIDSMHNSGKLSSSDAIQLKKIAFSALQNPIINSWFDSDWSVKNENSIILPNIEGDNSTFSTMRPDRVLIKGDDAIVIDYKFGAERNTHAKQIIRYKELLLSMGYKNVKGYLWYITNDIIKEI